MGPASGKYWMISWSIFGAPPQNCLFASKRTYWSLTSWTRWNGPDPTIEALSNALTSFAVPLAAS